LYPARNFSTATSLLALIVFLALNVNSGHG